MVMKCGTVRNRSSFGSASRKSVGVFNRTVARPVGTARRAKSSARATPASTIAAAPSASVRRRGVVAAWARGRGVGTRALRLFARYAFDMLRLERLELLVQPGNEASLALGERVGFTREGVMRSHSLVRGERKDMVMMSLLRRELRDG